MTPFTRRDSDTPWAYGFITGLASAWFGIALGVALMAVIG